MFSSLQWPDVLLDVAWSESSPDVLVTSSGDGKLQLWNYTSQKVMFIDLLSKFVVILFNLFVSGAFPFGMYLLKSIMETPEQFARSVQV